ncbi:MAG: cupin domain-containing protein [Pseudomonadota bacterium]
MKAKLHLLVIGWLALSHQAIAQDAFAFFRGEVFPPPRDTPAAWLQELHKADALLNANIAVAEFLPNTRLAWHNHPGGQILVITDGVGYYQEKGKPRQIVRVGDVIRCEPGVEHWHGGSLESGMTYVATSPAQRGGTVWGEPVADADYAGAAVDRRSARKGNLLKADDTFPFNMTATTFAPGRKPAWHNEPGGQILVVTQGTGYYQEKGGPQRIVRRGDVIKSARGVEHWHGASDENGVTFIAITPVVTEPK